MTTIIARTTPKDHANGALGKWWVEYRVRKLTDDKRYQIEQPGVSYALETRYCHEQDSEYCRGHNGQWQVWDYGINAEDAALSCYGDTRYQEAESLSRVHTAVKIKAEQARVRNARIAELLEVTHFDGGNKFAGRQVKEIDIEADEKEQAQADFERELRKARLSKAALLKREDCQEHVVARIDAIKAKVLSQYKIRLAERKERHIAAMKELQELQELQCG